MARYQHQTLLAMIARRAFSIMELLAVLAIISIVAVVTVPAVNSIAKSSSLTSAQDQLLAELALARQDAIARNREVEIRFYRYKDPVLASSLEQFRAFQTFSYNDNGEAEPLGRLKKLPTGIILDSGNTLSSLLDSASRKSWGAETKPPLADLGTDYEAYVFRFRPEGSTDLDPFPAVPWCVTLHEANAGDALKEPPSNYATIVIDPLNGALLQYRP